MTVPLDLSPPGRRIPADLQARLRSMFGSVAGTHYSRCEVDERTNLAGTVVTRDLVVRAKGWSPSLHHCSIEVRHPLDEFDDAFRDTLITRLEDVVERQRRRAADGLRHGLDEPLPNFQRHYVKVDGVDVERRLEMRHLVVDRSTQAVAVGPLTDWGTIVGSIRRGLYDLHQGRHHLGNGYHAGDEYSVFEDGDVRGVSIRMALPGRPCVHIDGRRVHIMDVHLPESVVPSMSGRRVGDVARVHPDLDDRIVEKAALIDHKDKDGLPVRYLELVMEPQWEPLEARRSTGR
jgi:hypothetical protein